MAEAENVEEDVVIDFSGTPDQDSQNGWTEMFGEVRAEEPKVEKMGGIETAEESESEDDDDEEEKPKTAKPGSDGGFNDFSDQFLEHLSVKPAQATSMQQEARVQSIKGDSFIDMWSDAPYPALYYERNSFGMMLNKRLKYLTCLWAMYGKKGDRPTINESTAIPTINGKMGGCVKIDAVTYDPAKVLRGEMNGKNYTKIAEKVARDKSGGPRGLVAGPAGYIPSKLLLKEHRKKGRT